MTPYGDEILPLLQSMLDQGGLVGAHYTDTSYKFFKAYKGRLNGVPKQLMKHIEIGRKWPHAGVVDNQAHCIIKVKNQFLAFSNNMPSTLLYGPLTYDE